MAELRIHDQSSTYFKSLRSQGTMVNVDLNLPDRSGTILTEHELLEILNKESKLNTEAILKPDIRETPIDPDGFAGPIPIASYITTEVFLGEHELTEWIASDSENFDTITDGSSDIVFKTSWYPNLTQPREQVYVKYRFRSGNIVSPWSDTIKFKAMDKGIITPEISVEEDALEPTLKCTPLRTYGSFTNIQHLSSTWRIVDVKTEQAVHEEIDSTTNKISFKVPADKLDPKRKYKVYVRHNTNNAEPAWQHSKWSIGHYLTPNSKISRPTLTFDTTGEPRVIGSAYEGEGSHIATEWCVYNSSGARIAEFPYDTKYLTSFPMKRFLSQGHRYLVTARYISAESKSPKGKVEITIPGTAGTGNDNTKTMTINHTTDDRGFSLSVVPFTSPVLEDIQYFRYQIRFDITDGVTGLKHVKIVNELKNDQEVEDSWNKSLSYSFTPDQSYKIWFANMNVTDPTITINGNAIRMGLTTEERYVATSSLKRFDYTLGNMNLEENNTLSPLARFTDPTGADKDICGFKSVVYELYKKNGSEWNKVRDETDTRNDMHRFNNLDNDTDYKIKAIHKTNIFNYSKEYEFRSASYIMAKPVVRVEGFGKKWNIKASGYSLTNYSGPNPEHKSTTYLVTNATTGMKVWESIKSESNKNEINIPESVMTLGTRYNVFVTFYSGNDIASETTQEQFYIKPVVVSFTGIDSNITAGKFVPKGTTFSIAGYKATDIDDGSDVPTEPLGKTDWKLEALRGGIKVKVEEKIGKTTEPGSWSPEIKLEDTDETIYVTAKCYSNSGVASEEKVITFTKFNKYIETCDDLWSLKEGSWDNGGLIDIVPMKCINTIDVVYRGEWGNDTNFRRPSYDTDSHFWLPGWRATYKGKLYDPLIKQEWKQYNPEATVGERWKLIEKDYKLPMPESLLRDMGLMPKGSSIKTNPGDSNLEPWHIRAETKTIKQSIVIDNYNKNNKTRSPWVKIFSPNTKKICFITNGPILENVCTNDIIARQPEYNQLDKYTLRIGTRLYYVRLSTKEEIMTLYRHIGTFYNNDQSVYPTDGYYLDFLQQTKSQHKGLVYEGNKLVERNVVARNSRLNGKILFTITPIIEEEAPYQDVKLRKEYPNFNCLGLHYGPSGKYEGNKVICYNTKGKTKGEDTNWFDGELSLMYDKYTDTGYFGRIHRDKLCNFKELIAKYGLVWPDKIATGDSNSDLDVSWFDVYYWHGTIGMIPNSSPYIKKSLMDLKSLGVIYGETLEGYHNYIGDTEYVNFGNNTNKFRFCISALTLQCLNINILTDTNGNILVGNFGGDHGNGLSQGDMFVDLLLKTGKPSGVISNPDLVFEDPDTDQTHETDLYLKTHVRGNSFTKDLTFNGNNSDLKLYNISTTANKDIGLLGKSHLENIDNWRKYRTLETYGPIITKSDCGLYQSNSIRKATTESSMTEDVYPAFRPWLKIIPEGLEGNLYSPVPYITNTDKGSKTKKVTSTYWGSWETYSGNMEIRYEYEKGYWYYPLTHHWSNGNTTYGEENAGTYGPVKTGRQETRVNTPQPPYITRTEKSSRKKKVTNTYWGSWESYSSTEDIRYEYETGYYYYTITNYWSDGDITTSEERDGSFGPDKTGRSEKRTKAAPPPPTKPPYSQPSVSITGSGDISWDGDTSIKVAYSFSHGYNLSGGSGYRVINVSYSNALEATVLNQDKSDSGSSSSGHLAVIFSDVYGGSDIHAIGSTTVTVTIGPDSGHTGSVMTLSDTNTVYMR